MDPTQFIRAYNVGLGVVGIVMDGGFGGSIIVATEYDWRMSCWN
jgi:hypothetical protein